MSRGNAADALDARLFGPADSAIHVPDCWKCPQCTYRLAQRTVCKADGRQDQRPRCPKDNAELARVTWRELAEDQAERIEALNRKVAQLHERMHLQDPVAWPRKAPEIHDWAAEMSSFHGRQAHIERMTVHTSQHALDESLESARVHDRYARNLKQLATTVATRIRIDGAIAALCIAQRNEDAIDAESSQKEADTARAATRAAVRRLLTHVSVAD